MLPQTLKHPLQPVIHVLYSVSAFILFSTVTF